ncbi:Tetracycline resistance protein TetB/drug resistance transporter [Phaffia rhodozyma]|uniref:Tetracycline resistance protein TetB/drug resistance transporter n=1 Tax=Phaffia rhodozyma TaxID=264483 RepID=A0A0F7SM67_PHARH|nr:Tetracycline resistance protein TetB/drug resistance transporter [Phaffia rhodozyma]
MPGPVSLSPERDRAFLANSIDRSHQEPIEGDFTIRAVSVGLLVGSVVALSNLYFGLQTGWISMMSLQSALLGFGIFKILPSFLPFKKPFTMQENVVMQTTAVATGTLPLAAGLVGIIPALEMLEESIDGQGPVIFTFWQLIAWSLAVAFFGVFLAAPLRKQVIVKEKLAFPSGTATAQLIAVLHDQPPPSEPSGGLRNRYKSVRTQDYTSDISPSISRSPSPELPDLEEGLDEQVEAIGTTAWRLLASSFASSAGLTFLSILFPVVYSIPVFDIFPGHLAANHLWTFSPSLSYVGQGIIMGFPTTLAMNLGMITGWGILGPLSARMGWAPGDVGSSKDGARGWILWVALAIMISESMISLIPIVIATIRPYISYRKQRSSSSVFTRVPASDRGEAYVDPHMFDDDEEGGEGSDTNNEEYETEDRLVPLNWVVIGLMGSAFLGVVLIRALFGPDGIKPWATALGFVLACLLSLLGVRALGETDLNPVSGIGKISQLLFAVLQPHNVVANIVAGAVAEAGAQQAGDLMQDLKTGALLRASPRSQFYGQLVGSLASVFVSTAAFKMYKSVYVIPGPAFPAPTAGVWLNLARLLNDGHLPPYAPTFMIAFGLLFALTSIIKTLGPTLFPDARRLNRLGAILPSGVAFAIGFLNTPSFSLARFVGGILALYWSSRPGARADGSTKGGGQGAGARGKVPLAAIVIASGFVLGEGLMSIVGLGMKSAGVGVTSSTSSSVEKPPKELLPPPPVRSSVDLTDRRLLAKLENVGRPDSTVSDPQTDRTENGEDLVGGHTPLGMEGEKDGHLAGRTEGGEEDERKKGDLTDQTNLLPFRQVILVFFGLSIALFCTLVDQTIVSTALPEIGAVFQDSEKSGWVATSYLLTSTAFQPLYGRFSDIFGRKIMLIIALTIFFIGSLACALSKTMIQLIVFRALSGMGGGAIITLAMIIVSDIVSLKDRGKFSGITGSVVVLSNCIGPLIGGVFTERLTWRWCFWINIPLTAISVIVVIFVLPLKRVQGSWKEKIGRIDYAGAGLTLAGTTVFLLPISWGGTEHAWNSAAVIAPLVIGILLFLLFFWMETRVALPIIPMRIFRNITVAGIMSSTFLTGCIFYAQLYYLPQYFQVVLDASAIRSGILLFPLVFPQVFFSFSSGYLVSKTGEYRINLCLGFFVWTIGLGLISTLDENTSLGKIIGYQILCGAGAGQTFQTGLIAVQAAVSRSEMAVVTATRNFVRLLGGTIALAVCQALLNNAVRNSLTGSSLISSSEISTITSNPTKINDLDLSPEQVAFALKAYVQGLRHIWYFCIPCAGLSFFLVVFCVKHHSLTRADDVERKQEGHAWMANKNMTKDQRQALNLEKGILSTPPSRPLSPSNGKPSGVLVDSSDPSARLEDSTKDDERRMEDDIASRLEGELVDGQGANRTTPTK